MPLGHQFHPVTTGAPRVSCTLKGLRRSVSGRPPGCRSGKVLSERRLGYRDRSPVVTGPVSQGSPHQTVSAYRRWLRRALLFLKDHSRIPGTIIRGSEWGPRAFVLSVPTQRPGMCVALFYRRLRPRRRRYIGYRVSLDLTLPTGLIFPPISPLF